MLFRIKIINLRECFNRKMQRLRVCSQADWRNKILLWLGNSMKKKSFTSQRWKKYPFLWNIFKNKMRIWGIIWWRVKIWINTSNRRKMDFTFNLTTMPNKSSTLNLSSTTWANLRKKYKLLLRKLNNNQTQAVTPKFKY